MIIFQDYLRATNKRITYGLTIGYAEDGGYSCIDHNIFPVFEINTEEMTN